MMPTLAQHRRRRHRVRIERRALAHLHDRDVALERLRSRQRCAAHPAAPPAAACGGIARSPQAHSPRPPPAHRASLLDAAQAASPHARPASFASFSRVVITHPRRRVHRRGLRIASLVRRWSTHDASSCRLTANCPLPPGGFRARPRGRTSQCVSGARASSTRPEIPGTAGRAPPRSAPPSSRRAAPGMRRTDRARLPASLSRLRSHSSAPLKRFQPGSVAARLASRHFGWRGAFWNSASFGKNLSTNVWMRR